MKKKILQMTAILTATMMLFAGCKTRTVTVVDPVNSGMPSEFYTDADPKPPAAEAKEESGFSVNLTEGRGGEKVDVKAPTNEQVTGLSKASIALFNQLLTDGEANDNVLISPLSIMMALGMIENGANGETLQQMEQYVNGGMKVPEMNGVMAFYRQRMNDSVSVSWNVANSLWIKDDGNINPKAEFLNHAVDYYNAEVYKAPFDQGTVNDINVWVNKNTNEMIPSILDQIPDTAFMYLVNAIAFEGSWADAFKDGGIREDYDFTNADGSVSKVTMMQGKADRYFELEGGTGFVKYYMGSEYAFVGILPKEGTSTQDYIAAIAKNNADFAEAVRESNTGDVIVKLPKFENDYDTDLAKTYAKLGMNLPFSDAADFTNMLEDSKRDEQIGRILHKTHIEVDQNGTKAAAATVVEMRLKSAIMVDEPVRIDLDRAFVYAIVDVKTGLPVFIGCQNSME